MAALLPSTMKIIDDLAARPNYGQDWDYTMRRQMQEILPGIFLGPYAAAMKKELANLKAIGITHIICVRQREEEGVVRMNFESDFHYLLVEMSDASVQMVMPQLPRVRDFIDGCIMGGGKVLLHGNAGISRSGTLMVAYIMEKRGLPFNTALRVVQARRFCVSPNEEFQRQLSEYEMVFRARQTTVITGVPSKKRCFESDDEDEMESDDIEVRGAPPEPAWYEQQRCEQMAEQMAEQQQEESFQMQLGSPAAFLEQPVDLPRGDGYAGGGQQYLSPEQQYLSPEQAQAHMEMMAAEGGGWGAIDVPISRGEGF